MSRYPIHDENEEVAIQTSFTYQYDIPNTIQPPLYSTLTNESCNTYYNLQSPTEEWLNANTTALDQVILNYNYNNQQSIPSDSNYTQSEASSFGTRTPDVEVMSSQSLLPYVSLLNPPFFDDELSSMTNNYYYYSSDDAYYSSVQQDIIAISEKDHMMLLQEKNSVLENSVLTSHIPQCNEPIPQQDSLVNQSNITDEDIFLNHLSREQLIERVVQLETEKTTLVIPQQQTEEKEKQLLCKKKQQHQDDNAKMHSCHWISCTVQESTLEKLMTHICESHIGSGKATYFCEWKDCSRNKKPFMKRHKMHNHMRTHTGERPFACTALGKKKRRKAPIFCIF
ncbi:MAG: hypothetical protein EXX96DRAFT_525552 [Benjaminiella poitrasii]|nr:MAG: hypothetical protein EXX96DRAFT_525552 [Benjaminiella poitrasii]